MRDSNYPHNAREKNENHQARSKNVAILENSYPADVDLQLIVDAWSDLPESVQACIMAIIKAEVGNV